MRTIILLASATLLAGAATAAFSASAVPTTGAIQPGQYRVTSVIAGKSKPTSRLECYSADTIAELFVLPRAEGKCTTTRNVSAGGRIDIARSCIVPRGTAMGSILGTYTPTSFAIRTMMRSPALPASLDVRMTGQRTAATCAAD